jgi:hypothetical protein
MYHTNMLVPIKMIVMSLTCPTHVTMEGGGSSECGKPDLEQQTDMEYKVRGSPGTAVLIEIPCEQLVTSETHTINLFDILLLITHRVCLSLLTECDVLINYSIKETVLIEGWLTHCQFEK